MVGLQDRGINRIDTHHVETLSGVQGTVWLSESSITFDGNRPTRLLLVDDRILTLYHGSDISGPIEMSQLLYVLVNGF